MNLSGFLARTQQKRMKNYQKRVTENNTGIPDTLPPTDCTNTTEKHLPRKYTKGDEAFGLPNAHAPRKQQPPND
jgi:hypothetical protein